MFRIEQSGMTITRLILSSTLAAFAITSALAQETGYIKAHGKPGDAGVFINGQYVGPATRFTVPEKYQAPAGDIEITLKDPRYEDFVTKVSVRPKKTTKIKYALKPGSRQNLPSAACAWAAASLSHSCPSRRATLVQCISMTS